ncbi:hypothetical protein [Endozoicomonas atrinae]|uniref:hypothetical protein n=1 Tax=Endozoicomonas atrinae TaxID=1333660 RepID=UPI001112FA01|nr:hypothetical protein [Endozoicomonas atrinae]
MQQQMQASALLPSRSRATDSSASRTSQVYHAPSVATHSPDGNVHFALEDANVFLLFKKMEGLKLKKIEDKNKVEFQLSTDTQRDVTNVCITPHPDSSNLVEARKQLERVYTEFMDKCRVREISVPQHKQKSIVDLALKEVEGMYFNLVTYREGRELAFFGVGKTAEEACKEFQTLLGS